MTPPCRRWDSPGGTPPGPWGRRRAVVQRRRTARLSSLRPPRSGRCGQASEGSRTRSRYSQSCPHLRGRSREALSRTSLSNLSPLAAVLCRIQEASQSHTSPSTYVHPRPGLAPPNRSFEIDVSFDSVGDVMKSTCTYFSFEILNLIADAIFLLRT